MRPRIVSILYMIEELDRTANPIEDDQTDRARANPVYRKFMDIPGVGPMSALSFYTAIEDPNVSGDRPMLPFTLAGRRAFINRAKARAADRSAKWATA